MNARNGRDARNGSAAGNMGAALGGIRRSLSTFWNERNRREQNMLALALIVIVLGLFYALLIDPALSGRAELAHRLPALRQQAADMQRMAREAATLTEKAGAPAPALSNAALSASLSARGLSTQNLSVSGDLAKVQLTGVSFANLIDWLQSAQQGLRLSVIDASIVAQKQPGMVNADLTLRRQAGTEAQ